MRRVGVDHYMIIEVRHPRDFQNIPAQHNRIFAQRSSTFSKMFPRVSRGAGVRTLDVCARIKNAMIRKKEAWRETRARVERNRDEIVLGRIGKISYVGHKKRADSQSEWR